MPAGDEEQRLTGQDQRAPSHAAHQVICRLPPPRGSTQPCTCSAPVRPPDARLGIRRRLRSPRGRCRRVCHGGERGEPRPPQRRLAGLAKNGTPGRRSPPCPGWPTHARPSLSRRRCRRRRTRCYRRRRRRRRARRRRRRACRRLDQPGCTAGCNPRAATPAHSGCSRRAHRLQPPRTPAATPTHSGCSPRCPDAQAKSEQADYQKLLAQRQKEKTSQRRSARSSRASEE